MFCSPICFATPSANARRCAAFALIVVVSSGAGAQVSTFAGGVNAAAIQTQVDAFRASLGPLNANVAGSFGSGRREINWDGVPDGSSAPNNLAANFFNVTSPRGVVFSTPGTGFAVSASTASAMPLRFGNIDPSYGNTFATFSAQRLFTAIGSNIVDVNFFVAGSSVSALSRGFGAVFSDVDLASTTSLQFYDGTNSLLGTYSTPVGAFSFLGVSFGSSVVSRVRITSGNTALAANATDQDGVSRDVVVMDDFIYAETVPDTVVPEPSTYALMATGLLAIALMRRRIQQN